MGKEVTVYIVQNDDWDSAAVDIHLSLDSAIQYLLENDSYIQISDFDNLTFGEIISIFSDCGYGIEEYKILIDEN